MTDFKKKIAEKKAEIDERTVKLETLMKNTAFWEEPDAAEIFEEERGKILDLIDSVDDLYLEEERQMKERQKDPAYDGFSPSLTTEEELVFYRDHSIRTKSEILAATDQIKKQLQNSASDRPIPTERLLPLLDAFSQEITALQLMDLDQEWWQYEIAVRDTGITLSLCHTEIIYDYANIPGEKNQPGFLPNQVFPIHTTRAKLLSPDEFGALYGVSGGTVRQWIRRGKLRSASKFGKEWRIPELTRVASGEHYVDGSYSWDQELPDPPEGFEELNEYDHASISSVRGQKDLFQVCFTRWDGEGETDDSWYKVISRKAKEQLELYLISEPLVECINNYYGEFIEKPDPDAENLVGE